MDSQNREIEIDVNKCLRAIKKQFKLVILGTLIGALIGIFVAFFWINQKNLYESVSTVYSMSNNTDTKEMVIKMNDRAGRIKSLAIAERAEMILGDGSITEEQIYGMIYGVMDKSSEYSTTLYIKAYSSDKKKAIAVANAVSEAFVAQMISEGENDVQILDNASESTTSIYYDAPKKRIAVMIAATILGALAAAFVISFREVVSTKMYTAKDATLNGTIEIIGVIPEFKKQ